MEYLEEQYLNTPLNNLSLETYSNGLLACLNNTYSDFLVLNHKYELYYSTNTFQPITQSIK